MSILLNIKNMWCLDMFKKSKKNYLNSNELILKGMLKRRKLALASIAHICDNRQLIRVVK